MKTSQNSSDSPFRRFAKLAKALVAVPKKEADEKAAEWRRNRPKTREVDERLHEKLKHVDLAKLKKAISP
jgi:hypothetical protein